MKTKKYLVLAILFVCAVVILAVRVSGDIREDTKAYGVSTLTGLKNVMAIPLWGMHFEFEQEKLPESVQEMERRDKEREQQQVKLAPSTPIKLFQQVESTLQKYGLEFTKETIELTKNEAILWIKISLKKVCDSSYCAFSVSLALDQEVELTRNDQIRVHTTTWPLSSLPPKIIIVDMTKIDEALKEEVNNRVSEFIKDYLTANPKEQSKDKEKNK